MASDKSTATKLLREAGFHYLGSSKHELWELEGIRIRLPMGGKMSPHLFQAVKSQVRRALTGQATVKGIQP